MRREIMREAINRPYIFPVGVTVPFETLTGIMGATRTGLEGLWHKLNDNTQGYNDERDLGVPDSQNWYGPTGRWEDGRVR